MLWVKKCRNLSWDGGHISLSKNKYFSRAEIVEVFFVLLYLLTKQSEETQYIILFYLSTTPIYPCNITHDIYIYIFLYTADIFRTKTDSPRIFLEHEGIFCG